MSGPFPGALAADVDVDEFADRIEADPARVAVEQPVVERTGLDARQEEVDRVAVGVLAAAGDLAALLDQREVVLGVAKPGDDPDLADLEVARGGDDPRQQRWRDRALAGGEPAAKDRAAIGLAGVALGDPGRTGERSNLVGAQVVGPHRSVRPLTGPRRAALIFGHCSLALEIGVLLGR